jgi:hypothetical protein
MTLAAVREFGDSLLGGASRIHLIGVAGRALRMRRSSSSHRRFERVIPM